MTMSEGPGAAGPVIDSRLSFVAALQSAIGTARDRGARRMIWSDADFEAWPLGQAALLQTLTEWVRLPQRRLVLLARSFDRLRRDAPRFVAWRQTWAHAVDAYGPNPGDEDDLPSLLLVESVIVVQRLDASRWRGRVGTEASELRGWSEQLDAFLQRCEPAFPATTLGL